MKIILFESVLKKLCRTFKLVITMLKRFTALPSKFYMIILIIQQIKIFFASVILFFPSINAKRKMNSFINNTN